MILKRIMFAGWCCALVLAFYIFEPLSDWVDENRILSVIGFLALVAYPVAKVFPGIEESGDWKYDD